MVDRKCKKNNNDTMATSLPTPGNEHPEFLTRFQPCNNEKSTPFHVTKPLPALGLSRHKIYALRDPNSSPPLTLSLSLSGETVRAVNQINTGMSPSPIAAMPCISLI